MIYVGKAVNLAARVRSYWQKEATFFPKIATMISQIAVTDYVEVESEFDALLLEVRLIQKFKPRYNTRLKDDKSYLYIKITQSEDFPKVLTARRPTPERSDGGQARREKIPGNIYFGPFPSARSVQNTLRFLRRLFPYCNCNFRVCQNRGSCLWTEIGLDSGPCLGKISQREYHKLIRRLILLLSGKRGQLIETLTREMRILASRQEFEQAQLLKRQIEGIEYLTRSRVEPEVYLEQPDFLKEHRTEELNSLRALLNLKEIPNRIECFDISDIFGREATGSMVVLKGGGADKSSYRRFRVHPPVGGKAKPNDVAMIAEVISRRLNHQEWPPPNLLVVDGGKGQVSAAQKALVEHNLSLPVIGLAKRLEEIIVPLATVKQNGKKTAFKTLRLPASAPALQLLKRLRDEAHRFALTYHRKLRTWRLFQDKSQFDT